MMKTMLEEKLAIEKVYAAGNEKHDTIIGVPVTVARGWYRFTVPGWDSVEVYGKKSAERVIHGRLDRAVRNTLGIPD